MNQTSLEPTPPLRVDNPLLKEDCKDGEEYEDDPRQVQPVQPRHWGQGGNQYVGNQHLCGLQQGYLARIDVL